MWIDEGPVRRAATGAVRRAATTAEPQSLTPRPQVTQQSRPVGSVTVRRAAELAERVAEAGRALDRERYVDVRRMLKPIVKEAPELASAHELLGLAHYRLGAFGLAATELEAFRALDRGVDHHPVLADCYRALRRYGEIGPLWDELRQASPSAALVAEGRIVVAGSLVDRRRIDEAIELLRPSEKVPARVRDHHLRLWYVLADLYDRNGEPTKARALFARVRSVDPSFADVEDRLRNLGA